MMGSESSPESLEGEKISNLLLIPHAELIFIVAAKMLIILLNDG